MREGGVEKESCPALGGGSKTRKIILGGLMTRSPLKTFFTLAVLFAGLGILLDITAYQVDWYGIKNSPPVKELQLARFYMSSGQVKAAIEEYRQVIENASSGISDTASSELERLLVSEKTSDGKMTGYLAYITWFYPSRLYALSAASAVLWLIILGVSLFGKKPLFVILPIRDHTGLGLRDDLPQVAADRLRELTWRVNDLESSAHTIAESLDVPVMGMISDGASIDSVALIETALMLSGGPSNLPLSRLLYSFRLWLEQPQYLIRGSLNKGNKCLCLHFLLVNKKKGTVEASWRVDIEADSESEAFTQIIDSIIYPVWFHFGQGITARQWEVLKALHDGLQEFQCYRDQGCKPQYLDKARQYMQYALALDPGYMLAKYNLGLLELKAGEYEEARDLFRDILTSTKDANLHQLASYHCGVALFHMSQDWSYQRAAKYFKDILDNPHDNPQNVIDLARSTLAVTYARMAAREPGERDKYVSLALQEAKEVLASKRATKETLANAIAAEGYAHLAQGNALDAVSSFTQALEKKPESVACLIGLGEAHLKAGQKERAIEVFRRAEIVSPPGCFASYKLGGIYRDMGETEQAIQAYQRAGDLAAAHFALGKLFLNKQEYEEALEEFRKAADQNKRLSEAWVNIAWVIGEMKTQDEALLKEAETSARRALHAERNSPQIWHRHAVLARALLDRGKNDVALKEAQKAVELEPERAQARYYLALAEFKMGQLAKARTDAEMLLKPDQMEWKTAAQKLLAQLGQEKM